jgi:hypothetical protein
VVILKLERTSNDFECKTSILYPYFFLHMISCFNDEKIMHLNMDINRNAIIIQVLAFHCSCELVSLK